MRGGAQRPRSPTPPQMRQNEIGFDIPAESGALIACRKPMPCVEFTRANGYLGLDRRCSPTRVCRQRDSIKK